jgi:hypothetical protein
MSAIGQLGLLLVAYPVSSSSSGYIILSKSSTRAPAIRPLVATHSDGNEPVTHRRARRDEVIAITLGAWPTLRSLSLIYLGFHCRLTLVSQWTSPPHDDVARVRKTTTRMSSRRPAPGEREDRVVTWCSGSRDHLGRSVFRRRANRPEKQRRTTARSEGANPSEDMLHPSPKRAIDRMLSRPGRPHHTHHMGATVLLGLS